MRDRRQLSVAGRQSSPTFAAKTGPPTVIAFLLAACAVLGFTGCSKKDETREAAVPVQVATVLKTGLEKTVSAQAILFPLQQSAITPKISAPVEKFYVQRGSRVRAGQLLAVLENRDLAAAAKQNKGDYEQAQASYETTTAASLPADMQKAQLDVDSAKRTYDAQQKLYESRQELFREGALPRKDLDQAGVDFTNAKNQYEIAQKHLDAMKAVGKQQTLKSATGQLTSARGRYEGATAQLGYSEIHSPIDGVVADRPLYPGEGKVTIISPALDPNSTTVEVWVQGRNPQQHLKPGTSVQVLMVAHTIPDAVVIPSVALLTGDDGATSVMLVGNDQRAHQKPVKVGIRQGDQIQILDGVEAGDRVVASGAYGLPDNTKIRVETADAGEAGKNGSKPAPDKNDSGDKDEKK